MVLGSNIPRNTNISSAFSGSPEHDNLLRLGMERLWDFEHNPSACYDPVAPQDNARMAPALLRVWLAYVTQHPGRFLAQLLARASRWFFPGWHVVSILSVLAFACSTFLFRGKGNSAWRTVWMLTIAYSCALLDRVLRAAPSRGDPAGVDRLGAAWRRAPGPDRAPPSTPATCARPARRYWGTLAVLYETGSRECLRRSSLRGRAQRPLARQGASCAGGVP